LRSAFCRSRESEQSVCSVCLCRSATATFDLSRKCKVINWHIQLDPHTQSCRSNNHSPRRSRSCASTTAKPRNTAPPSGKLPSLLRPLRSQCTNQHPDNLDNSSFLTQQYPAMKKANPHTPILIREALEAEPRVWARYG
jgi:hypothetical protein